MTFNDTAELPVRTPFRLDLTVEALRRLAANVVDVVDDGTLYRALRDERGTTLVAVRSASASSIEVRTTGDGGLRWVPVVGRMLGVDCKLDGWRKRAALVPWLRPWARAFDGIKPPRYASLWEACAHAIVFQQISIHAAGSIMRRCVEALDAPVVADGVACVPFPGPLDWLNAGEEVLRRAGLSRNKVSHLNSVATAFTSGALVDAELEALPSAAAAERLRSIRGLGPWSAAVVLLRGLGRLDVFPMKDSGVARSLVRLTGGPADVDGLLETLGPYRGMLYYHLLLSRLHPDATATSVRRVVKDA